MSSILWGAMSCWFGPCGLRLCIFPAVFSQLVTSLVVVFTCNVFAVVSVLQFFLLWARPAIYFQRSSSLQLYLLRPLLCNFLLWASAFCYLYCVVSVLATVLACCVLRPCNLPCCFGLSPCGISAATGLVPTILFQ
jgi:hypothetical protein